MAPEYLSKEGEFSAQEGFFPLARPPVVGITARQAERSGVKTQFAFEWYVRAVFRAGGLPIIVPIYGHLGEGEVEQISAQVLDIVQALIFTGGQDLDPARYGAPRHPMTQDPNPEKERSEFSLMRAALERDLPLLAICAGFQKLNVHYGGTLHQHLPEALGGKVSHSVSDRRGEPAHSVSVVEGTLLHRVYGAAELGVNSTHHQGVKDVGRGLKVCATAADGLVEALCDPKKRFVLGMQWHPEALFDSHEEHLRPFLALVAAARERAAG